MTGVGVSEEQRSGRGAAIQEEPSCCLASAPYALLTQHAYKGRNAETLAPLCIH